MHYFLLIYFNSKPLHDSSRHAAHHEEDQLFINSNWYSHALCWLAAGRIRMELVLSWSDVCVCSYLCTIQLSPLMKISMSALSGIHALHTCLNCNGPWKQHMNYMSPEASYSMGTRGHFCQAQSTYDTKMTST
jgi:hypothetical protein